MYPGASPLPPSPSAVSLVLSSSPLLSLLLVPGHGGMGGTFRRPVAFAFSFSFSSSFPYPSARALVCPPFPRPCGLFPLCTPSPPPGPLCVVRCSSCRVWGATLCTAPDTDRTCSCGRPNGRRTAWSCRTTDTRICSRRRQHDKPVVLVLWRLPPAPSPPTSPFLPPLS